MVKQHDWVAWHAAYDRPGSSLSRRLEVVRQQVRRALDDLPARPPGAAPHTLVSLCAGDGRDVLPVLAEHPRRDDVRVLLVELDGALVAAAREAVAALGLARVEVRGTDAGPVDTYLDHLPADVLLVCGVFGNVPPDDVRRTVDALPGMLADDGVVLWTRGRGGDGNEQAQVIRRRCVRAGLTEVSFTAPDDARFRVGVHRRPAGTVDAAPPAPGTRLFAFA